MTSQGLGFGKAGDLSWSLNAPCCKQGRENTVAVHTHTMTTQVCTQDDDLLYRTYDKITRIITLVNYNYRFVLIMLNTFKQFTG
jgi:hypothetical protein